METRASRCFFGCVPEQYTIAIHGDRTKADCRQESSNGRRLGQRRPRERIPASTWSVAPSPEESSSRSPSALIP